MPAVRLPLYRLRRLGLARRPGRFQPYAVNNRPAATSLKPITKECTANDRTAISPLSVLPQIRALGRHRGRNPLPLFWTASGAELLFTGSELWFQLECDYTEIEPWVSIELNGAWIARQALTPGRNRVCAFRGMTPGTPKHVRLLNDVQPMQQDPTHFLQLNAVEYAGGEFLPLPEPRCRLEFVGDSITSGEGTLGARQEEDWIGAFFSAENHYARLTPMRSGLSTALSPRVLGHRLRVGQ